MLAPTSARWRATASATRMPSRAALFLTVDPTNAEIDALCEHFLRNQGNRAHADRVRARHQQVARGG